MSKKKFWVASEVEVDPVEKEQREKLLRFTQGERPPEALGRNLQGIEDAQRWLLHPSNYRVSDMSIMEFDGLVPYISRRAAERLIREPWDNGLFVVAVSEQRRIRSGGSDEIEEKEQ